MRNKIIGVALLLAVRSLWAASYEDGVAFRQAQNFGAAAAVFREVVQREPGNLLALEQLATMESWQNHYDESIRVWRQYIGKAPDSVTGHIGLARVLYWRGQRAEALRELTQADKLQADNPDTLVLQGDVLLADGRPAAARASYMRAQALQGGSPELTQKIARAVVPAHWRLDAGVIADHFSAQRGAENSLYSQLGYKASATTTIYVRAERVYSFREVDYGLSAGGYFQPVAWLALNAEAGFTPDDANFRAKNTVLLNSDWLFSPRFQPLLGVKHARYTVGATTGSVTTLTPGLRVNLAPISVELRYSRSDNVDNSKTHVVLGKVSLEREGYTPYLSYASGKEALPPQAVADIKVVVAGCVFDLNPVWSVRVDLSHEQRKGFYDHDAAGVGLAYRF